MARYSFKPSVVEFEPVKEHPYQIGLRGEPCEPPEGLTGRVRDDWVRKWRNGYEQRMWDAKAWRIEADNAAVMAE